MIAIPAGEFTMGSDLEVERPPHPVSVAAFEIDKFEVTNEQFEKFVAETGYATEAEKAGDTSWRYWAKDKSNHPVVKVSWNDAVAFCEWAEKRLPTEAEWEKAARGTDGFTYPWGNDWDVNKVNAKESGYRGTTIVGSFPSGASPYGVMDMAGNVSELDERLVPAVSRLSGRRRRGPVLRREISRDSRRWLVQRPESGAHHRAERQFRDRGQRRYRLPLRQIAYRLMAYRLWPNSIACHLLSAG